MAHYQVSITQYPSGKWGFVGSLPEALTITRKDHLGHLRQVSKITSTKEQAEWLLAQSNKGGS